MHGGWQHVLLPQGQTPKRDGAERREKSNEFFGDFFFFFGNKVGLISSSTTLLFPHQNVAFKLTF
jgi:hypothetical protein